MNGRSPVFVPPCVSEALVVFSGQTDLVWLRFLRAGFRHCFTILRIGERWITYDPLSHRTEISVLEAHHDADLATDLAAHLDAAGHTVLHVRPSPVPLRAAPWGPYTCVEAVKRALGLRAARVFTPWQLFRHLVARGATPIPVASHRKQDFFP